MVDQVGSFSQLLIDGASSFLQVRVDTGNDLIGFAQIYTNNGNSVSLDQEIDLSAFDPPLTPAFSAGGFDYYNITFTYTPGSPERLSAVALSETGNAPASEWLAFGNGPVNNGTSVPTGDGALGGLSGNDIVNGSLNGSPLDPIPTPPNGFVVDETGTVTIEPTNPDAPCFLTGTLIATPAGETRVEDLVIGDLVTTVDGRAVPVKWVGRKAIATRFAAPDRLRLVTIRAGALGGGVPRVDLTVTADHALLIDGLLVNAGALVDGIDILAPDPRGFGEIVTVWHVETEAHEVILANGTPAETFIDNVSRRTFDNFAEYAALYGEKERPMNELALPRVMSRRQLPAALARSLAAARAA